MNLKQRDQEIIWHPYTQHQMTMPPIPIVRGEGVYLFDENGKRYLDLISSWLVNLHGHAQPDIAKAIYQQACSLEHIIFSGFTHEPAIVLAENLLDLLPDKLTKVFYSDNGSTAVEVALKIAYQYWQNNGENRKRILAFENGYHGDTFGAMSVGKKIGFFQHFHDLLFDVDFFPYPSTWINDHAIEEKEKNILKNISHFLEDKGSEVAALIIEPLAQGVAGMQICRPQFLRELERMMKSYDILIIYDEVMTGFGRTGDFFACNKSNTQPDMVCLSKGMTGGFLPLAATVCQEKIYQAFLGDSFKSALAHGHSYTANPIACAAAIASLNILKNPQTILQIKMIEKVHHQILQNIASDFPIEKMRYCGTIAAFDLKRDTFVYGSNESVKLREKFMEQGLIIRPLGNIIYLLPPRLVIYFEA